MSKSKNISDALLQIGVQSKDAKNANEKMKKWISKQPVDHAGGYVNLENSTFQVTLTEMGYLVSHLDWKKDKAQDGSLVPKHDLFSIDWETQSKVVEAWKKRVDDFLLIENSLINSRSQETPQRVKTSRSTR